MNSKNSFSMCVAMMLMCGLTMFMVALKSNDAYGTEGGGGGSGGGATDCGNMNNAMTDLCGEDGEKGGGASWRIFKAKDNVYGLDDWTGYGNGILTGSWKTTAIENCKDNGGWFASYGWDGRYKSHMGYRDFDFQIGPASREDGNLITEADYNSYNAKDLTYLTENNFPNNTKVYQETVLDIYNKMKNKSHTGIPTGTSWFCVDPNKFIKKAKLVAYAAVSGTYNPSDGSRTYLTKNGTTTNIISEAWQSSSEEVSVGSSASVDTSNFNPNGYSWEIWGSSCNSSTKRECEKNDLKSGNNNVYAYYTRNSFVGEVDVIGVDGNGGFGTGEAGEESKEASKNWDCNNSGCDVEFVFYLKTKAGSGHTSYNINNGLTWYGFDSPDDISKRKEVWRVTKHLKPGEKGCGKIDFYPYGSLSNEDKRHAEACVFINVSTFKGKIEVTGDTSGVVSSADEDKNKMYKIDNCSLPEGCKVSFKHVLEQESGNGSTDWNVEKTLNSNNASYELERGKFSTGTQEVVNDRDVVLYPGMIVCEKLSFKVDNVSSNNTELKVCVFALGAVGVSLKMDVSKDGGKEYYEDEIYAKPGDDLRFRATYIPMLQYTYGLISDKIQINNGDVLPGSGRNLNTIGVAFNKYKSDGLKKWNNSFSICDDLFSSCKRYFGDIGNVGRLEKTDDLKVKKQDVGKEIKRVAKTNIEDSTKTTPSKVVFDSMDGYSVGNVITEGVEDDASAKIPYNFNTGVEVLMDRDKVFYAGENNSMSFNVSVLKKINSETTDGSESNAYATLMRNAKIRVIVYYANDEKAENKSWGSLDSDLCNYYEMSEDGGGCRYIVSETVPELSPRFGEAKKISASVDIGDISAGSEICAAVAIYPANSGGDKNLDSNGSKTWHISESKCFRIAKRPSFQVWGGSMYSDGGFSVPIAYKNNRSFGSWVEWGLTAKGVVQGLASGAGLGGPIDASVNGKDYCTISTLSFANQNCSKGEVGGLKDISVDKPDLISGLLSNENVDVDDKTSDIGEINDFGNNNGNKSTKIFKPENGEITINGNITYYDGSYSNLENIPKIIIYAKNINIACNVTRIDAVLIAKETINTCPTYDNNGYSYKYNNPANSNQLRINGTVIADKLELNRTYGAATGDNSAIPAEIINYDSSLYLWIKGQDKDARSGSVKNVYTRELAPRY